MAETKWTPGPWRHAAVDGGWDGVYEPGGMVVCKLALNEPANATLIGAAPELYIALAAVLGWLDDNPTGIGMLTAANHARQVLAKARGES